PSGSAGSPVSAASVVRVSSARRRSTRYRATRRRGSRSVTGSSSAGLDAMAPTPTPTVRPTTDAPNLGTPRGQRGCRAPVRVRALDLTPTHADAPGEARRRTTMTHERRTADDVQRPAPGPFLVIGGLLSFVLCAL